MYLIEKNTILHERYFYLVYEIILFMIMNNNERKLIKKSNIILMIYIN